MIAISAQHPIVLKAYNGQMRPYVLIRSGLWALIHRNSFYHLVSKATLLDEDGMLMRIDSGDDSFILNAKG